MSNEGNEEGRGISVNQSQGCPVPVGNSVCGEANSLEIMKEFNRLYEERMQQVDCEAGGDCLQEKIKLQREWIRNLTQQNEMLVRAVQELEYEATERVQQLEEKLHKSAQCLCEKISRLKDDIRNVLEFIRRIRESEDWNIDGLFFHNITKEDLLGNKFANKLTKDDSNEGEKLLNEKERTVQELTQKVNYYSSFGDVESMAKELRLRQVECDSLKQEMADMGQALTEEVALKHDHIIMLRKDVKNLEDRCLQADKQTAFKEDIIRELRKEIKQLKQQCTQEEIRKLNDTIDELQMNLDRTRMTQDEEEMIHQKEISQLNETINQLEHDLKVIQEKYEKDAKTCKICRGKSKVGFLESTQVQANLESKESELVKALNDAKSKMTVEIEKRNNKIQMLKNKVNELESSLNTCEERAANLQEAVKLYSNSVNVLETAKEGSLDQIQQQKITIANLQQALVEAKQEVDEMRRKNQENEIIRQGIMSMLENVLQDTEEENEFIKRQSRVVNLEYEKLQDVNFALEFEHCDSLQDIDVLENQLNKYKGLFKENEAQTKKLSKQKRCYEEIIAYFKHEMSLMADQLNNLQELLTLSNETAQQESSKIMHAFLEVQSLNDKLSSQLCACEQKVQLENQMNQLHEAKICELQNLIQEKEMDLTKHDQAILNIRKTLNDSLKQNEELQETILELNGTINQLQNAINEYERENCESKQSCLEFQEQIGGYCSKLEQLKKSLDDKTADSLKLEMAYNNEKRALKAAQKQLQQTERLQQENHKDLANELEDLKHKLTLSIENNDKLCQECETLQNQLANLSRKEAVKDLEIKRYRKIVSDLKATMMELNSELNKNLAQKELGISCKNTNCRQNREKDDLKSQDMLSCPCEVEFYQKMVDILKKSVSDLKNKVNQTQLRNNNLEEEIKQKDEKLLEIQKAKDELYQKLLRSQLNDSKITEQEREIDQLRQELQLKNLQLNDVKKSAQEINGSKCVQLAFAQEEITNLKTEMTNILNRQHNLKRENEELQNQAAQLHCNIACLNEKNKMFKDQIDQYLIRVRNLNTEKETLLRKNKELLSELRSLQSMTCSADKQQRTTDSLKQLEADIEDLKHNKEEICLESKNVINNVRAWVTEQKRINSYVVKREQEFMETIKKLSYEKTSTSQAQHIPTNTCRANKSREYSNLCTSPCSLGSQGTASFYDGESPSPSPEYGVNEWYSSTFRSESDNDSEEDYCVSTLENLTQQMKKSNQIWMDEKRIRRECKVSKDSKDKKIVFE